MRIRSVWLNSLLLLVVFTILCGGLYPLLVTLAARGFFHDRAGGSLLRIHGRVIGSSLLAQNSDGPGYFHERPSACGYSTLPSAASNLAPTSAALRDTIGQRRLRFLKENGLGPETVVPIEMLCASGSGLDPHISPRAARLQAGRVAERRRMSAVQKRRLDDLIVFLTESSQLGILGEARINVLRLNFMLDNTPEFRILK
jgi:potassium-transporting ATPase KdpC subunit